MPHANSKQGLWAIALQDLKWKGFQQILECLCPAIPAQTTLVPSQTWEKAERQSGNSLRREVTSFPLVQREALEHSLVSDYSEGISNDTALQPFSVWHYSKREPWNQCCSFLKEHRVLQGTDMVIVVIMFAMYCSPRSIKPRCNYWARDKSHRTNMRNIPGEMSEQR